MSEAAFELHSSRLVTPTCSRSRPMILKAHDLKGLAGFGHAVPSKRSSPPAAKSAVCIGGVGRSQGASSRNVSSYRDFSTPDAVADLRSFTLDQGGDRLDAAARIHRQAGAERVARIE